MATNFRRKIEEIDFFYRRLVCNLTIDLYSDSGVPIQIGIHVSQFRFLRSNQRDHVRYKTAHVT